MAKWLDVVALEVAAGGLRPARADELVLRSGDRLRGEVTQVESGYRLVHPVLGDLTIPARDVETVVRGSPATIAASAPTPEICTRCPVPPEEKRSAAKRPWTFWIGVGLTNDSGNTEKFQWRLDTEASYRWRTNRIRGRLNWFYEESSGVQTEGKFFASLIYERQVWSRGFLFAMGILDRDDFADILYRAGWFVGYGRDLIKREKTSFTLKLGAGMVVESRKDVPVIQTPAFFAALDYRHEFGGGDTFRAYAYVTPYVDYTERSPTRLELTYVHPLRRHLALTAGFLLDYVPDPPEDIKSYDTKVTFGIRWTP